VLQQALPSLLGFAFAWISLAVLAGGGGRQRGDRRAAAEWSDAEEEGEYSDASEEAPAATTGRRR
jgi:hypothetical protein